jgi:hypothetical protein
MSEFDDGMNEGNAAMAASCAETFEIVKNGNLGTYSAISIDNLQINATLAPGGMKNDSQVVMWVKDTVIATSGLVDGCVVVVRGKRLRVTGIEKDGNDTQMVVCGPAGVKV